MNDEKTLIAFYDHLFRQGKYLILILYVFFLNFQDFSRTISSFSIFQDFSRPGNVFFLFSRFSRLSRVHGNSADEVLHHYISTVTIHCDLTPSQHKLLSFLPQWLKHSIYTYIITSPVFNRF